VDLICAASWKEKLMKSSHFRRLGLALIGVVALVDFALGIYHLTHHGLGSGITELVLVSLLVTAVHLISQAQKSEATFL
jgi:hypothetical protein